MGPIQTVNKLFESKSANFSFVFRYFKEIGNKVKGLVKVIASISLFSIFSHQITDFIFIHWE